MTEPANEDHNCKKCLEIDTDDMVQCDICDRWYHFGCVGVTESVADESWVCEGCALARHTTHSSTPATTDVNGRGENQAYATLPQSNAGYVQLAHDSGNARNTLVPNPSSTAAATTQYAPQITAPIPLIYTAPVTSNMANATWQTHPNQKASAPATSNMPNTTWQIHQQTSSVKPKATPHLFQPGTSYLHVPNQTTATITNAQYLEKITQQRNLELQKLEEEMEAKRQYLESKYSILASTSCLPMPHNQTISTPVAHMGSTLTPLANIGHTSEPVAG